jgi:hypothetical protein
VVTWKGENKMMLYEVDLRSRKTGNSIECILSTKNHDDAYNCADEWNRKNVPDYDINIPHDRYIDGTDGLYAEVYETPYQLAHGIGKYKKY